MKVASLPLGMCLNTKINESSQFLNTKLKRYTEMDINICRLKKRYNGDLIQKPFRLVFRPQLQKTLLSCLTI